jgi:DNA topoisomerase-3
MTKKLIIAEKPSVAADIAKALGGFTKHDDYFENDTHVISSAVGHLLELSCPEEFEVKRGKWSFAHLPVIPPHFALSPIEKTESRLKVLNKLIKRKDVDGLINACDAGREGELIFNYIAQHSKSGKPVQRLWLQSMTQGAIRDGFSRLRPGREMEGLGDAAVCRSESDWLVGINGTRAMTAFNSKTGGFHLTTVGRVQTPTLAIVVEREKKFVSSNHARIGKLKPALPPRQVTTTVNGLMRNTRAKTMTSTRGLIASGKKNVLMPSAPQPWASPVSLPKNPSRKLACRRYSSI